MEEEIKWANIGEASGGDQRDSRIAFLPSMDKEEVVVPTSEGESKVVIGPWKNHGEIGRLPFIPHVVVAKAVDITGVEGSQNPNEILRLDRLSVLFCHGVREHGLLRTVLGKKPLREIIVGLRLQGHRVDVLAVCNKPTDPSDTQLDDLADLGVVYVQGAETLTNMNWVDGGWNVTINPGEGGVVKMKQWEQSPHAIRFSDFSTQG